MLNDCPSTQAMAQFADGVLSESEHQSLVEHLASCQECSDWMAVLMETKEALPHLFQEDQSLAPAPTIPPPEQKISPPPPKKPAAVKQPMGQWKPLLIAASVALIAGVSWWGTRLSEPPGLESVAIAERLQALPMAVAPAPGLEVAQGFATSSPSPEHSAFWAGRLMTRTAHQLIQNQPDAAARSLGQVEQLSLEGSVTRQALAWRTWAERYSDPKSVILPEIRQWSGRFVEPPHTPWFQLGTLVEGSQLALQHRDHDFFVHLPIRELQHELTQAQALPGVIGALDTLELLALTPEPTPALWVNTGEAVNDLILLFE